MTVNLTSSAIYTIRNYQRRKLPVIRNQDGKYLLTKQDLKPSSKHEEKLCKVHWPTSTKLFCWKLLLWKVVLTDIKGFEKWKGQSYFSSQIMTKLIWETSSRVKKEEVDIWASCSKATTWTDTTLGKWDVGGHSTHASYVRTII